VRVTGVQFAPSGRGFCAASTEGLLVYELDVDSRFDPFELDVDVTPQSTLKALATKDYLKALAMAFRLGEKALVQRVFEAVPMSDVALVVKALPDVYLARLIRLVVARAEAGPHVEFCLRWLEAIMTSWGRVLRERRNEFAPEVRSISRVIATLERELRKLGESNGYMVDFLLNQSTEPTNGLDELAVEDLKADDDEWMGFD
jgi:periodic tryptophan protein 2